jgi:hypothetical protein
VQRPPAKQYVAPSKRFDILFETVEENVQAGKEAQTNCNQGQPLDTYYYWQRWVEDEDFRLLCFRSPAFAKEKAEFSKVYPKLRVE